MSKIQVGFTIFFVAIAVLALLMFSGIIPTPGKCTGNDCQKPGDTKLIIWGTLPQSAMQNALIDIRKSVGTEVTVTYAEKKADTLKLDLLDAWSRDESPDIVLFPMERLLELKGTLLPFPEKDINERTIKDNFIEGGELVVAAEGVMALPFAVDPMVMYWNQDLFNKDRITTPPKTWDDVRSLTRVLTKTDGRGRILQSTIAIGESRNVDHAKDIMSLFFLQVGDGIVTRSAQTHNPLISFGGNDLEKGASTPAVSALSFYTGFANVRSLQYSWNGSFSSSLDSFVEGTAALYLGPASDHTVITNKNPHLNFDVAPVPQLANATNVTFGHVYVLGLPKGGKNPQGAYSFAVALSGGNKDLTKDVTGTLLLPSAKRSILSEGTGDATLSVFYREALIAKGWLDPDPEKTNDIFARMINDTLSEAVSPAESITSARTQINALLKSIETENP